MKTLFLILILALPLTAQDKIWILLGEHEQISYLINAQSDGKSAEVKNVILKGDASGYYGVTRWDIDCEKNTIRIVNVKVFTPEGKLLKEDKEYGAVTKPEKNSFADIALRKYWCSIE